MSERSAVPPELGREAVEEKLKLIAGQLIAAHRAKRERILIHYARQAKVDPGEWGGQPGKLFMRLIKIYHPDRLAHFLDRIRGLAERGDREGLDGLSVLIMPAAFRIEEPASAPAAAGRTRTEDFSPDPEEYGYGEEDFGYSEGAWSAVDEGEEEFDGEDIEEEGGPIDIIEAIKRSYLGNLDAYPTPFELSMLEGDLDLSDCGIESLDGAEFLKCVSSLNLSGNSIQNAEPLRHMQALEYLDLSGNLLESADELRECESLSELDLSGNDIEDFAFLADMPNLSCVNVSGNPPMDERLLKRLAEKDVLVIR